MIDEKFIILALVLNSIGTLSYLIDTLKGKVKPNKVTWFLWALAPLIVFGAQINQNVGWSSWFTFISGFNPFLIFVASFVNKKSQWKITKVDLICGLMSLTGIILWYLTRIGNIAIALSILADGAAAYPTVAKSFYAPETENWPTYFLAMLSGLVTLLTIRHWTFAAWGFPLYIFLTTLLITVLVKFKIGKRIKLFAD